MTPDAGFNSYGREGVWSSGRISPSSRCQIGFVAMRGPPQLAQCSSQRSSGTHTISLITARAACPDSPATPALCEGIPPQAKPTGAPRWTEIAEIDRQPARERRFGAGRADAEVLPSWYLRNVRKSYCIAAWPLTKVHNPPIV